MKSMEKKAEERYPYERADKYTGDFGFIDYWNKVMDFKREAFIAGWQEAQQEGWIDVKDRLPEVGHDKNYPKCSKDCWVSDGKYVRTGFYEDGEWINSETQEEFEFLEVKYWMIKVVPAPPQSINQNDKQ